ncbi:hypothetical protein ASG43_12770 [Aureimonas sp. Leaf454]|uniref:DUF1217 domain-containing protein n=1 Tax=Aureimonas sp. Leaf454 TaxID=1736381 RepID=UPI000702005F|nr:DUF1217 domain-containing protein [Aureimonas sp. Leaf454]KQT45160.1 hypothetical protein ASG43_12770 [Aureimonas sp. Leaf454]
MLSTLASYRIYSNDIAKSLARIEASSSVARDVTYYEENIGKVKSVDDFLADQRLYTYALKAYGLSDQASSKGFIRKVIESDLKDSSSFANKLNDSRYRDFASAFNFKASATTKVAQSTGQMESMIEAYSERSIRGSVAAASKTAAFATALGSVSSIDDILDNPAIYDVALRSIGMDPVLTSKDFVRSVFVSMSGTSPVDGLTPLATLAAKFNVSADGTLPAGTNALSTIDADDVIYAYFKATGNAAGPAFAAHQTAYYNSNIGRIDGAEDIAGDPRLFEYVTTAFGLDSTIETTSYIHQVLKDDPTDPTGLLAKLPTDSSANVARKEKLMALNAAFNFAADGTIPAGQAVQTAAAAKTTEDGFYKNYQTAANARDASAVSTYKTILSKTKSLVDLMAFDPVFGRDALNVALKAFDIDPATTSLTQIRRALESDASDPNSYVNKLGDERFQNLAAAFNFDSTGKIRTERLIQSLSAQTTTGQLYAATFKTPSDAQKTQITSDTKAYLQGLADVDTLDDLLKSGKTLTYALTAYGLGKEALDTAKLRKVLTSDLGDPKSYVYTLKDARYEKFAAAFNVTPQGTVRLETSGVQTESKRLSTQNLFLLQTLEEQVGDQSEGTRLALYFMRKSPEIRSTLSILADKALFEVVRTALSLPDSFTQLDIDKQVKEIDKRLKVADLQDKGKLDKFISRFAALYDLKNNSGASSPVMGLFAGSDTTTSLLASL